MMEDVCDFGNMVENMTLNYSKLSTVEQPLSFLGVSAIISGHPNDVISDYVVNQTSN